MGRGGCDLQSGVSSVSEVKRIQQRGSSCVGEEACTCAAADGTRPFQHVCIANVNSQGTATAVKLKLDVKRRATQSCVCKATPLTYHHEGTLQRIEQDLRQEFVHDALQPGAWCHLLFLQLIWYIDVPPLVIISKSLDKVVNLVLCFSVLGMVQRFPAYLPLYSISILPRAEWYSRLGCKDWNRT